LSKVLVRIEVLLLLFVVAPANAWEVLPGGPKPLIGTLLDYSDGLAPGLICWWIMNEGAGNYLFDSTGNGFSGQISGPVWAGHTLDFDGASDHYVRCDNTVIDLIEESNSFSCVAWVYNRDLSSDAAIFGSWDDHLTGWNNQFLLHMDTDDGADGYTGTVYLNTGTCTNSRSEANAIANVWQHVALTWDGYTLKTYVDGTEVLSTSKSGTINTSNSPFVLGRTKSGQKLLDGLISDTVLYDCALTASEIRMLHKTSYRVARSPSLARFSLPSAPPSGGGDVQIHRGITGPFFRSVF